MRFGLNEDTIAKMIAVLEQYPNVDKVLLFGSRAKGNYRPDSDIDLAIKGQDITFKQTAKIAAQLDELNLGVAVDLLDYNAIKEPALIDHIDRVGVEFYSRWKEVRLGDTAEITSSKRIFFSDYVTSGVPFYRSKEIIEKAQGDNISTNLFISREKFDDIKKKYGSPVNGDILISAVGERAGIPYFVCNDGDFYFKDGNIIWFRNFDSAISSSFLVYYFNCSIGQQRLESTMIGSAQKALTIIGLKNLDVAFPPLSEQTIIASILSSIDDKIDLLHRQNKTLEQIAETLFRQWFVEEAEEDWEKKSFSGLIETTLGGEWGKECAEGEYELQVQCIRGTDIADLETGIPTRTPIRFTKQKKFESIEIKDGDLVMEISGGTDNQSTGRTTYINDDVKKLFKLPLVFSNFCRLIRPKKKEYSFFLHSYIHHLYEQGDLFNLENGSSGIKNLNYKALLFDLEYHMPDEKVILKFNKEVELYYHKINKNKHQIRILTQTRDALLPKLMSGEVRVSLK